MPHRIVEIDELARLVIDELVEISPRTTVSFALTCRSFWGPALSSLWKRQSSLITLVEVLPQHTWIEGARYVRSLAIEHDPLPEDWDRLRQYASWMHELIIDLGGITNDALSRLSSNSSDGVLCPKLERLDWEVDVSCAPLPFFRLFLSLRLKRVNFHTRYPHFGVLWDQLPLVKEVISCLPASLEELSLACGPWNGEPLRDAISSLVLRCGPPLRSFGSSTRLSKEAVCHLTRLPNLSSWVAVGEPPQAFSPTTFPPLEELRLKWGAIPWLHLLAGNEEGKARNGLAPAAATMNTNIKETLKLLHCPEDTPVGSALLSSISSFRNLVTLSVGSGCYEMEDFCAFGLVDDDVENLAVTLPSLVSLQLGKVCGLNSCRTTVSSLLSISTRCLGLTTLETHFNTRTIVGDIQRLLGEDSGRGKPRCELQSLWVGRLPLRVCEEDIGTVAMGFVDIFPCLGCVSSRGLRGRRWESVTSKLRD